MSQDHQQHQVDPAEAHLSPLALIKHRLARQSQTLQNLQAIVGNTVHALQQDINYLNQIVGAIEQHIEPQQPAGVPAGRAPTLAVQASVDPTAVFVPPFPAVDQPGQAQGPVSMGQAVGGAQIAMSRLQEAAQQRQAQAPVRPARVAPTQDPAPEQAVLITAPTPTNRTPINAAPNGTDFVGPFIGTASVFTKFLSPQVYYGGRGFVAPEYASLIQHNDDVLRYTPLSLDQNNWPTGFYRDEQTRLQQFMVRNSKIQVVVNGLPSAETAVTVSFAPFNERVDVRNLSVDQMSLVYSMVHASLLAICRAGGDGNVS